MTENHLGNPNVILGMFGDINAVSIVGHGNGSIVSNRGLDITDELLI